MEKTQVTITKQQLEILQHSLGLDKFGRCHYYRDGRELYGFMPNRNHYCAGGSDEDVCRELVALGLMKQHLTTEVFNYYNCSVTDDGKRMVREQSPEPPKVTRSKARYDRFLRADSGLSFGEWMKQTDSTGKWV